MQLSLAVLGTVMLMIGGPFSLEELVGRYVEARRPAETVSVLVDEEDAIEGAIFHSDVI